MPWLIRRVHRASVIRFGGILSVAAVGLALGGCGSSMQVATDYDRTANFAPLRTYSWRTGTPLPNPLMSQRVIAAVDDQLKAKGFARVDSGGDVVVTYHASADRQLDVQSFQTGGTYSCWGGCMTNTTVTPVTVGTLIVDIVDGKSNKMLWRGTMSDAVSGNPSENERKIHDGMRQMFAQFPPKTKA